MAYKAPKTIATHPGVAECDDAQAGGCDEGVKHDVLLKDGWSFVGFQDGIRRCGFFKTVAEFLEAEPKLIL